MEKDNLISHSGESPTIEETTLEDSVVLDENVPGYSKENNIATYDSYENITSILNTNVGDTNLEEKLKEMIRQNEDLVLTNSGSPTESQETDNTTDGNSVNNNIESTADKDNLLASSESYPDWYKNEWKEHRKHVFILSSSGKPIYTRYGDADDQASLFGTLLTLSQFLHHSQQDTLRCMKAGRHKVVFLSREHVVLVIATHSPANLMPEPVHSLLLQLTYVYNQVVSILTLSRLKSIYEQRPNYDLRRLLSGAEKFIDSLLDSMDSSPAYLLSSIRCLPLDQSIRESIAQSITPNVKIKDLVFAIMVTGSQLIALVRMKQFLLHPIDLHLLCNLVCSSESFKQAESWTPVCLPKFDSNGYLHCHVSYLDEGCRVCLLLLSVNKDSFFVLSECRNKIMEKMTKNNSMKQLIEALPNEFQTPIRATNPLLNPSNPSLNPSDPSSNISDPSPSPTIPPSDSPHEIATSPPTKRPPFSAGYSMADTNVPGILHFIYKARTTGQYTQPDYTHPYTTSHDVERLCSLYRFIYCLIHTPGRNLKIYYHTGAHEAILVWVESNFELFTTFNPLTSKTSATQMVFKLLKWIKKEESKLFILNSHTI